MHGTEQRPPGTQRTARSVLRRRSAREHGGTAVVLAAVAAAGLGLSACGGGPSASPGVAAAPSLTTGPQAPGGGSPNSRAEPAGGTAGSSTGARGGVVTTPTQASSPSEQALEFATCMRSHGLTSFPDPNSAGGFEFPVGGGINPQSPQFRSAQQACQKYLPPGPGSGSPPSAQALAAMLKISQCMRRHGIAGFPDPRISAPPLSPGIGEISDIDGVILVFPSSIDRQSPQFTQAAAACRFPLHNH